MNVIKIETDGKRITDINQLKNIDIFSSFGIGDTEHKEEIKLLYDRIVKNKDKILNGLKDALIKKCQEDDSFKTKYYTEILNFVSQNDLDVKGMEDIRL